MLYRETRILLVYNSWVLYNTGNWILRPPADLNALFYGPIIIGLIRYSVMKAILRDWMSRDDYFLYALRGQRLTILCPVDGFEDAVTSAFIM